MFWYCLSFSDLTLTISDIHLFLTSFFCCSFVFTMEFNVTADSWLSYYKDHISTDDVNKQMGQILDRIKDNPGVVCLTVDGVNELILLHQVHVLGPSIVTPIKKVIALSDSDRSADGFKLRRDTLFQDHEIFVPKWSQLKGANSADAVAALCSPVSNPTKLKCKNILMVPP
jgi:hypothetical protein